MKKKRLIFIIFVFLLPSAYALHQEELYSGTVYPGQNVTVNNKTFIFNLGSITDKINIVTPSGGIIVQQGKCEIIDFFNVCFDETEFWYHNYTIDKEYFKAKVSVSEILAKVELTRTIENKKPLIGEETRIDVSFKNTGDRDATDVVFKDNFPSEFVVTEITNCVREGNDIRWYGTLSPALEKSCSYKIKSLNKTTNKSIATLQYNNGMRIETVDSDKIKIVVPDYQLNISINLGKDKLSVGEETNFTIILKNMNSEKNVQVTSFKISMPPGIKVTTLPNYMKINWNTYSWSGTLTPDENSMRFFFEIKAERKKDYDLITNAAFLIDNIRKEISTSNKLNVNGIEEVKEVEEEIVTDIDQTTDVGEEENLTVEESKEDVMTEPEKITTTTNITSEEDVKEKEEEKIKSIEGEGIIKKLFNNVYFIILDAIIISLIIIVIIRMIKAKRAL